MALKSLASWAIFRAPGLGDADPDRVVSLAEPPHRLSEHGDGPERARGEGRRGEEAEHQRRQHSHHHQRLDPLAAAAERRRS